MKRLAHSTAATGEYSLSPPVWWKLKLNLTKKLLLFKSIYFLLQTLLFYFNPLLLFHLYSEMRSTALLENVCEKVRRLRLNGNLLNDSSEISPLLEHFNGVRYVVRDCTQMLYTFTRAAYNILSHYYVATCTTQNARAPGEPIRERTGQQDVQEGRLLASCRPEQQQNQVDPG